MIITIDGPAGTGKSTVAQVVAQRLGFDFLDTGAMYRAIGLEALRRETDLETRASWRSSRRHCRIEFDWSAPPARRAAERRAGRAPAPRRRGDAGRVVRRAGAGDPRGAGAEQQQDRPRAAEPRHRGPRPGDGRVPARRAEVLPRRRPRPSAPAAGGAAPVARGDRGPPRDPATRSSPATTATPPARSARWRSRPTREMIDTTQPDAGAGGRRHRRQGQGARAGGGAATCTGELLRTDDRIRTSHHAARPDASDPPRAVHAGREHTVRLQVHAPGRAALHDAVFRPEGLRHRERPPHRRRCCSSPTTRATSTRCCSACSCRGRSATWPRASCSTNPCVRLADPLAWARSRFGRAAATSAR